MYRIFVGFVSGAFSGFLMGLLSHLLFQRKIFKSSLIMVDGSFLFKTLKFQGGSSLLLAAGLCVHLLTSGVFGALYILAADLLGLDGTTITSLGWISLYVALLWLSMLFIALPVAGEGIFGRKSGPLSWFEQLILHVVFLIIYYVCLVTTL
jgi:hypothetical protein